MSEIKPVYQLRDNDSEWASVSEDEFEWQKIHYPNDCRIVYFVEAYEALKAESAAQAKRIEELEAATEHLGLTPQQAADGLARYKARGEVMEAQRLAIKDLQKEIESLRKQVEAYKEEREPMRQSFASFKHFAERNRSWNGMSWHYYGHGLEKAYNSAVEMLKKLVANDLDLSASKNGE